MGLLDIPRYVEGIKEMMRNPGTPPDAYGMWLQRNPGKRAKAKSLKKRLRSGRR